MNYETFLQKLEDSPLPVVVELWAPWCVPCRQMAPALKKVTQQYTGKVDVWKINADEDPELVRALGVMGIPTIIAYQGKQKLFQRTGVQNESGLTALFEQVLTGKPAEKIPTPLDRIFRLVAGTALLVYAISFSPSTWLVLPAGLILFSAVYDRCPIYRAVAPRVKGWFKRVFQPDQAGS